MQKTHKSSALTFFLKATSDPMAHNPMAHNFSHSLAFAAKNALQETFEFNHDDLQVKSFFTYISSTAQILKAF